MSDYIKKEDITNNYKVPHFFKSDEDIKNGKVFAYLIPAGLVEKMTISDVAPVRHGRWEAIEWGENRSGKIIIGRAYQCSECRRIVDLEYDETLKDYPYCHCGAKMDEEVPDQDG